MSLESEVINESEEKQKIIKIIGGFDKIKLVSDNQGRQKFFKEVMDSLQAREYPMIKLNVPMEKGYGGYYTNRASLDLICLPKDTCTFNTETMEISFNDDKKFGIFVHECCHFLHLARDNGEFITPFLRGRRMKLDDMRTNPSLRRDCEFEAGYRSCLVDLAYHLCPMERTILELNLQNLIHYDWKYNVNVFILTHCDALSDEGREYLFKQIISNVDDIQEWADPTHQLNVPEYLIDKALEYEHRIVKKKKAEEPKKNEGFEPSFIELQN